jgi:hypothetical protein
MKTTLLAFTLTLTTAAGTIAFHLASLPNPTEAQKVLSTTANTIALSGTGAVFAMLNHGDRGKKDEQDDEEDKAE